MNSHSSDLCLLETVQSSVGSAPEPVDRDRHRVVEQCSPAVFVGKLPLSWKVNLSFFFF